MVISYNKNCSLTGDEQDGSAPGSRNRPNTMTKLNRDEEVTLEALGKICGVLKVNVGDIVDIFPEY